MSNETIEERRKQIRRQDDLCDLHRTDIKELYDKTGELSTKVNSVSSNIGLLIKFLAGVVVIASAMLGSIYLSVAKIDKQVATIVTTVSNSARNMDRVELVITDLQGRISKLEIAQESLRIQLEKDKR